MRHTELMDLGAEAGDILEGITDAFFALDADARFTYVNRQAEKLMGRGRAELVGRGMWDCFPELKGSRIEHEYQRAVRDQQPVEFEEFYAEGQVWLEVRADPNRRG